MVTFEEPPAGMSGRDFDAWCWRVHVLCRYSYRYLADACGVAEERVRRAVSRHERARAEDRRGRP